MPTVISVNDRILWLLPSAIAWWWIFTSHE